MENKRTPAVAAALQLVGVRPIITVLEAGLFGYLLVTALNAPPDARGPLWSVSRLLLAGAAFFLFLGSLLGTVSALRDLKAAKSGAGRTRSRAEKALPIVCYALAAALLAAALVTGTQAEKQLAAQSSLLFPR